MEKYNDKIGGDRYPYSKWGLFEIILAVALVLLIPYPTSPVIFTVFGKFPNEFILITLVTIGAVSWLLKNSGAQNEVVKKIKFSGICLAAYMLISFAATGNLTAVRDSATILIFSNLFLAIKPGSLVVVIRLYTWMISLLLFLSFLVSLPFWFGLFDISNWHVSKLNFIFPVNPAISRENWGDFSYHMPLYLALIPVEHERVHNLFNYQFSRQPLIFTESAYTWMYVSGIFLFALGDIKSRGRGFILTTCGLALLISVSVQGVIALLIGGFLVFMIKISKAFTRSPFVVFLMFVFTLLIAHYLEIDDLLVGLFGEGKSEQYQRYKEGVFWNDALEMSGVFGIVEERLDYFGFFPVILRYGSVGFALALLNWGWIILNSFKLLVGQRMTGWLLFCPIAVVVNTIIAFRIPQMNQLVSLMILLGSVYLINDGLHFDRDNAIRGL